MGDTYQLAYWFVESRGLTADSAGASPDSADSGFSVLKHKEAKEVVCYKTCCERITS